MCKQDHVSENASKMSHHKHIYLSLIILFPSLLIFLFAYQQKSNTNKQITFEPDSTDSIYGMFSTIPQEIDNIFKQDHFVEIRKMRESYLNGKADSSSNIFKYKELEEACRQAFGAFSQSKRALLVRGILTANRVFKKDNVFHRQYKLFTPGAMGIESVNDFDLNQSYEDLPLFYTIKKEGENQFKGDQYVELFKLKESFSNDRCYLTSISYKYKEMNEAYKQAFGAYSPYLRALFIRGTLTSHGQFNMNHVANNLNYKLMTPARMGLQIRGNINEEIR